MTHIVPTDAPLPTTATPADSSQDTATGPFVLVGTDKPNGRALIALDADAIDALLYYINDLGPGYDLTMDPGVYGIDQATADKTMDVIGRITAPLSKLKGYL